MILLTTIQKRIKRVIKPEHNIYYDFDVRYLAKWIENYSKCFPKFICENNYKIVFNSKLLRYEFYKI